MDADRSDKNVEQLFKAAALYVLGESKIPNLTGEQEQVAVTLEAIKASRELYEALKSEQTSLLSAGVLLERKTLAAARFEKLTGIRWRL